MPQLSPSYGILIFLITLSILFLTFSLSHWSSKPVSNYSESKKQLLTKEGSVYY